MVNRIWFTKVYHRIGPLEQPWRLTPKEFARHCKKAEPRLFTVARDETAALSDAIASVEADIGQRGAALYGL